jgi:hypothetical protein
MRKEWLANNFATPPFDGLQTGCICCWDYQAVVAQQISKTNNWTAFVMLRMSFIHPDL